MTNHPARIAVAGHVCVDVRVRPTTGFPDPGRLLDTEEISLHVGGAVGNFGRVMRAMAEPAFAIARVGHDAMGDTITQQLATWADVRYLSRSEQHPSSATVCFVLPDGERSFIHAKGANTDLTADHIPIDALADAGVHFLHVGYAMLLPALDGAPMVGVLRHASERGLTTSLDITWDPNGRWMHDVGPLLPHVDLFCPNDAEATALTGEVDPVLAGRALLAAGVRRLAVVTRGKDGVVACWPDGKVAEIPALPADIHDSTGAGDCFYAGLIVGLARGKTDVDALELGTRAATAALTNDAAAFASLT